MVNEAYTAVSVPRGELRFEPPVQRAAAIDKVVSLDQLARIAEAARHQDRKVVLCHGVFDVLHMGHLRHFEEAHRQGDILCVTITADKFVNKGPGRPVFPDTLRAEMCAGIGCVHWVAVNHAPHAVSVLEGVKPDVYVKGSDYSQDDDITGNIRLERETVEAHGGRIHFTNDIVFSSSELINRHLNLHDPELRNFLATMRDDGAEERILALIEECKNLRVLVVGDAIIDDYHYVSALGKSPKENLIATQFQSSEMFAGGIFALANHVAGICREVDIVTCIGTDPDRSEFIKSHLKPNVNLWYAEREGFPTTTKRRFIASGYFQKMFEVYYYDDQPLQGVVRQQIDTRILERAADYDLVIVNDFGHGLISRSTIEALTGSARFLAVNAQSNSGNMGFNLITRYSSADYVCIDAPEARLAIGDKHLDISAIVAEELPARIDCGKFIITQGKLGCLTCEGENTVQIIPALTQTVVDTVGAGDAFLGITAPLAFTGGCLRDVGFVGNIAGALKVQVLGHRSAIEKPALIKAVISLLK